MIEAALVTLAIAAAEAHNLAPELVCAVCEQESGWNTNAVRYEPAFFTNYVSRMLVDGKIDQSEADARSISWGLMQLMGENAREMGYAGRIGYLTDPATGLDYGCKLLARKLAAANGDVHKALLLWNGGSNTNYSQEVLDRCAHYRQKEQTV